MRIEHLKGSSITERDTHERLTISACAETKHKKTRQHYRKRCPTTSVSPQTQAEDLVLVAALTALEMVTDEGTSLHRNGLRGRDPEVWRLLALLEKAREKAREKSNDE